MDEEFIKRNRANLMKIVGLLALYIAVSTYFSTIEEYNKQKVTSKPITAQEMVHKRFGKDHDGLYVLVEDLGSLRKGYLREGTKSIKTRIAGLELTVNIDNSKDTLKTRLSLEDSTRLENYRFVFR